MQYGISQDFKLWSQLIPVFCIRHSGHRMPEQTESLVGECCSAKEVTLVPDPVTRIRADFTYDDAHTRVLTRRS